MHLCLEDRKDGKNSAQHPNHSDKTSIFFFLVHKNLKRLLKLYVTCKSAPTCVLYSPGFCEGGIRRNRLSFANCHIFNKGHGRCVGNGTFKVIICTNSSLQVPVSKTKIRFLHNRDTDIGITDKSSLEKLKSFDFPQLLEIPVNKQY